MKQSPELEVKKWRRVFNYSLLITVVGTVSLILTAPIASVMLKSLLYGVSLLVMTVGATATLISAAMMLYYSFKAEDFKYGGGYDL